ncbi:MAG: DUF5916 domain-containing protein [Gemmatimonadales bacterium]
MLPLALLGLLQAGPAGASQYRGATGGLRVTPPRIEATIEVDGVLDEPAWSRAARLTDFSQFSPSDGRPAEDPTEVLVWYSPTAIHFAARARAPAGTVRANLADRDQGIQNDDYIEIHLGTFDDGRQAFVFAVNPLGIQADGALSEGSTRRTAYSQGTERGGREAPDLSPDYLFHSKGRLTDEGYDVEVRIPFRALRYQSAERQDWSLQIVRRVAATGREDTWAPASRTATSFIRQSGALVGLEGLRRGRVLEVTPILSSTVDGAPAGVGWGYDGGRPEPGGNVKWVLSNDLTFNGTVNPDFSQVESDAGRLTPDPRRAVFFPEKRPFFLDGLEYFTTPSQVIYTRRIADPIGAAKVTGRIAGAGFGYLSAIDGRSTSISGLRRPVYNVLRVQRTIGGRSQLGVAYTDRIEGGDYNRVGQVDGRLGFGPLTSVSFYGAASRTRTGASVVSAPMAYAEFRHAGRRFGLTATVNAVSDRFTAGSGFISEPDIAQGSVTPSVTLYGRRGALIERFAGSVYADLLWAYPDFRSGRPARDRRIMPRANLTLRGGWDIGLTAFRFSYGYDGRLFRDYAIEVPTTGGLDTIPYPRAQRLLPLAGSVTLSSPEMAGVLLDVYLAFGEDVNYAEWSLADIWLGRFSLGYRPTPRLRAEGVLSLQSYHRSVDGSFIARTVLPRLKLEYQVSRAVFLRAVGEYRAFRRDDLRDVTRTEAPILIRDPNGGPFRRDLALATDRNTFRADLLFSYQPAPGTVFFAGYGSSLVDGDAFRFRDLERVSDNFFLKLSYLFRL